VKFGEIDKYLAFGQHLANLKITSQIPTTYNPFKTPINFKNQVFSTFQVILPEDYDVVEEYIPDKVLSDINRLKKTVSPHDYEEETKQLIYLGYYITLLRQTKDVSNEALIDLKRNVQRIIEDISYGKAGLGVKLNNVVEKYSYLERTPEKTFNLFNEIAHTYYEASQPSNLISNIPSPSQKPDEVVQGNRKLPTVTILFLAANPKDTVRLRLDEEAREIEDQIALAQRKKQLVIKNKGAVRIGDLQRIIDEERPTIVHFSGHGSEEGEIILEDNSGNARSVPSKALAKVFKILKKNIRCVVLNACFSEPQAEALRQNIDFVIGMKSAIRDEAAIKFASAFYLAIASECSVQEAFERGVTEIMLWGIPDEDVPQLLCRDTVDPTKTFLLEKTPKPQ
jgi:hypothetical protein